MLFDLHRGRVFSHAARLLDHWNLVPAHIGRGYRERGSDRTHQESSAEWCCQSADHRLVDADRTDGRVWRHAALRCDGPSHDVRGVLLKLSPVELSQGTAEGGEWIVRPSSSTVAVPPTGRRHSDSLVGHQLRHRARQRHAPPHAWLSRSAMEPTVGDQRGTAGNQHRECVFGRGGVSTNSMPLFQCLCAAVGARTAPA